jgi:hypothetical protein
MKVASHDVPQQTRHCLQKCKNACTATIKVPAAVIIDNCTSVIIVIMLRMKIIL